MELQEVGLLRGDLNVQEVRLSAVEESIANIKEQIKTKVEQLMKTQQCVSTQTAGQTVPTVSYTHLDVYKRQNIQCLNIFFNL